MVKASLIAALLSVGATSALAQTPAGDVDLNAFRPAVDSRGYFTVNASQMLGHLDVAFGLGSLSWGYKMLDFNDGTDTLKVEQIWAGTLIAALGLRLGPAELELGASAPILAVFSDRDPDSTGDPTTPNDDDRFTQSGQGLGNVGLHLKTRFLKASRHPVGLGLVGSVYLPTAGKEKFLGEKKLVPQIVAVVDKEFGRRFRVAVNGGFRMRSEAVTYTDTGGVQANSPATNQSLSVKNEIPFGAAMGFGVNPGKFELIAELTGAVPLDGENYYSMEALAGAKLYLASNSFLNLGGGFGLKNKEAANPDLRLFIGVVFEPAVGDRDGDGYKDDEDDCPDEPEDFDKFEDGDGCPEPDNDKDGILDVDDKCPLVAEDRDGDEDEDGCPEGNVGDRDGDGILDNVDKCPDDPEDKDGFEDEDGCPDPDNDKDGILDVDDLCPDDPEDRDGFEDEDGCPDPDNDRDRILDPDDRCPNEPETYNGKDDEDGCPDKGRVIDRGGELEILDVVEFETDSDVIKPVSYGILDAVAAALLGNPQIMLVEVQGHTDERGSDAYNLDLSNRRAASVRRYLTGKGVEDSRLESQGYGESQPKVQGHNEKAWARNRRVQFLILKRTDK